MYDVLQPDTRNATIAILKSKVVADATRRDRIELAGLGFHWPNASLTHSLENTLGYNPLRLALYSEATGAEDHVGLPDQRKFSPLFPSYRSTLANLLGLRFIATGAPIETIDPRLKPGDLPLLARTTDGYIYENPDAFAARAVRHRGQGRRFRLACWPTASGPTSTCAPPCCSSAPPARPSRRRARPGQRAHRQLPQHRGGRWKPTAPTAAGSSSTTSGTPGGSPRSTASRRKSCAPTSCSAPSPCRRAGTRCGSRSGRWPAPWPQLSEPPFPAMP